MTLDCVTMNQSLGNCINTPHWILHITKLCEVKSAQHVFYYILLKHCVTEMTPIVLILIKLIQLVNKRRGFCSLILNMNVRAFPEIQQRSFIASQVSLKSANNISIYKPETMSLHTITEHSSACTTNGLNLKSNT